MHGWNNNPSAKQFKESYRKILHLANVSVPLSANCIPKDDTVLLKYESTNNVQAIEEHVQENVGTNLEELSNPIFIEHNYFLVNNERVNEYADEIIAYISGYIVKIIIEKILCSDCKQLLVLSNTEKQSDRTSKLIQRKNRGKLFEASNDVITICKIAHKILRCNQHKLFTTKNILEYLICQAVHSVPSYVFDNNDHIFEQSPLFDHRNQVIKLILAQFFNLNLKHESKLLVDSVQRIRMKNNKITLFKNQ